jgi:CheY-like chemotaxis protein
MKQAYNILIVDDEPVNILLLKKILEVAGYLVVVARTGDETLQVMQLIHPDLVLLDIMMSGMNGFEVLDKIKSDPTTQTIPVIMVTASDNRGYRDESIRIGASAFLLKPITKKIILDTIGDILKAS